MFLNRFFEHGQDVRCLNGTVGVDAVAFLGKLVDHIEHPELPATDGMIAHEVPGPDMITMLCLLGKPCREPLAAFARLGSRHLQTLFSAHTLHQLLPTPQPCSISLRVILR